ncbi:MAG: hypothetical protein ACRDX8_04895 [Acidimicrobiales bacterium]
MSANEIVQIILTCADVLFLVAVLAYFLVTLAAMLTHVQGNLAKIAGGVRAIEDHCKIIGSGADAINANLKATAGSLTTAAVAAEAMAPVKSS